MVRDLLLDIVNKWRISDLILLFLLMLTFILSWLATLSLGLKILKVEIKIKRIIPGILLGSFISLFIKPFIPGALAFFSFLIPFLVFLKYYSKAKWIVASWVTFLVLLCSAIFPVLISPLLGSNHDLSLFFSQNKYSLPITGLMEPLGATLVLTFLTIFNIPLIPSPTPLLTSIDFYDIYLFLALCFWCFLSSIEVWKNLMRFSMWSLFVWTVAVAAFFAFYFHKINEQRKNQEYQKREQAQEQLIQELREEKNKKVGPQDIEEFSDRLQNTLKPADIDSEFPVYITSLPEMEFNDREQEILQLLAEGYSNPEIAKTLCLSTGRVANIISNNITPKTGLSERKLILYAAYWVKKYKKIP